MKYATNLLDVTYKPPMILLKNKKNKYKLKTLKNINKNNLY